MSLKGRVSARLHAIASEARRRGLLTLGAERQKRMLETEAERVALDAKIEGLLADTFPEQRALIEDESDRISVGLARRGAKTEGILRRELRRMLKVAGYAVPYFANTAKQAKEIVHERIIRLGEKYGLRLDAKASGRYTLPNGSHLFLAGLDNAAAINKARGSAYDCIVVDESQSTRGDQLEEFVQSVANPALMDRRGTLVLAGTPDPKRVNIFWQRAINGEDKRWKRHWWPLTSNTFLRDPAGYLKQMLDREGYTEQDPRFRAEFLGDVNAFDVSNVLFQDYMHTRNWIPTVPAHKFHHFVGYDLGLVDKAAWAVWAYSFHDRRIYLVHTFAQSGMDISEQGAVLTTLATRFPFLTVVVDEGALGKLIALELSNRFPNLTFEAAAKSDKALQVKLMNTDFRTSRAFLAGVDHVVNPKTGNFEIVDQWTRTTWDEMHQREQEGQPVDLLDSALYGWRACKTYRDIQAPAEPVDSWERTITDYDRGKRVTHFKRER